MRKCKGLIFDFNGVLLLDQHLHDEVWGDIWRKAGREPTEEEFKEHNHGRTNKLIFEYLLDRDLHGEELERRASEKELAYQTLARTQGDSYRLADGAVELFEELRGRGVPFTIATSSPPMNVAFYDEVLGLRQWFDMEKIVCADGTVRGKPFPDLYLKAAEMLSLPPSECVVIEDARSGIAAAHSAGIGRIIAIGPKDRWEELLLLEGVSQVVERLSDINIRKLLVF